jgi:hypothetical protein
MPAYAHSLSRGMAHCIQHDFASLINTYEQTRAGCGEIVTLGPQTAYGNDTSATPMSDLFRGGIP